MAPEYEKAAQALKGIANIAAIEADKERTDVQVQGYPTIKVFVDGKMSDYDGARTSEGIVDFMFRKLRNVQALLFRLLMNGWAEEQVATVKVATVQEMQEVLTKKM